MPFVSVKMIRARHVGWILCAALAACAAPQPQWEKAGASSTRVSEDMQQCRMQARLSPQPHSGPLGPGSGASPGMERLEERDLHDAQRFQKCMRDKGYTEKR
jgi:hypothetical protein